MGEKHHQREVPIRAFIAPDISYTRSLLPTITVEERDVTYYSVYDGKPKYFLRKSLADMEYSFAIRNPERRIEQCAKALQKLQSVASKPRPVAYIYVDEIWTGFVETHEEHRTVTEAVRQEARRAQNVLQKMQDYGLKTH